MKKKKYRSSFWFMDFFRFSNELPNKWMILFSNKSLQHFSHICDLVLVKLFKLLFEFVRWNVLFLNRDHFLEHCSMYCNTLCRLVLLQNIFSENFKSRKKLLPTKSLLLSDTKHPGNHVFDIGWCGGAKPYFFAKNVC